MFVHIFDFTSSAAPLAIPLASYAAPLASPLSSLALPLASPLSSCALPAALLFFSSSAFCLALVPADAAKYVR